MWGFGQVQRSSRPGDEKARCSHSRSLHPEQKEHEGVDAEANVHYFPDGSQALAEIVAKGVLERLKD